MVISLGTNIRGCVVFMYVCVQGNAHPTAIMYQPVPSACTPHIIPYHAFHAPPASPTTYLHSAATGGWRGFPQGVDIWEIKGRGIRWRLHCRGGWGVWYSWWGAQGQGGGGSGGWGWGTASWGDSLPQALSEGRKRVCEWFEVYVEVVLRWCVDACPGGVEERVRMIMTSTKGGTLYS